MKHAAEFNALSCALGHHIAEGRWLADRQFIDGDIHFWLRTGENGGIRKNLHQFSGWVAAAVYDRWLADGRPLPPGQPRRSLSWSPPGLGFTRLTVIDADGRSTSATVRLAP